MDLQTSSVGPQILAFTEDVSDHLAGVLKNGDLVAIPTETVYGLAADGTSDTAVAKIYALKKRPAFNPLIFHFATAADVLPYVQWTPLAQRLAALFWPGPLTLVLNQQSRAGLSTLATAGLTTVAVRVPGSEISRRLIQKVGKPLTAPSANPSERISPTSAYDVVQGFNSSVNLLILDGGPCRQGIESTILDLSGSEPILLRPGSITREALEDALQQPVRLPEIDDPIKSPGQQKRHYAPNCPLRLGAQWVEAHEALLAFGPYPLEGAAATLNLSVQSDMVEAAANLFAMLRALDDIHPQGIAVMPIPYDGVGVAINDRLTRAAVC